MPRLHEPYDLRKPECNRGELEHLGHWTEDLFRHGGYAKRLLLG